MSNIAWTQSAMETAIEIAMWVGATNYHPIEDSNYEGISPWIQDRTVEFEEQHKDTNWSEENFFETVEDWITAYAVVKRIES